MTDSRRNSPRASVSQRRVSITLGQWILGGPSWLLFVVGCCIGHFHGRFFVSDGTVVVHLQQQQLLHTDESSSSSRGLQQIRSSVQPQNNNNCLTDGDGWHTIHVFYGKTDHLDDDDDSRELPPPPQPSSTSTTSISSASVVVDNVQQSRHLQQPQPEKRRRWYSQARQDELVIALLRNKTDGYFIDLAANDATELSNTYALEKYHGWNGICIEPNPTYWHNLTYRKCMTIGAVVGAERMQGTISIARFNNSSFFSLSACSHFTNSSCHTRTQRSTFDSKQEIMEALRMKVLTMASDGNEAASVGTLYR
jgi:hypothetical protein